MSRPKVSIFIPCLVDQLFPKIGFAMVGVLERLGYLVHYNAEQTCCVEDVRFWGPGGATAPDLLADWLREHPGQGAAGLEIGVRIAVHTGPVVFGEVGTGGARRNLALGAATYVAARLQTVARRNTLVVSEDTLRLVRGIFRTEALEYKELKGVERPLSVHRVLEAAGVPSSLDAASRSLTPFVGRHRELGSLVDLWERATAGDGAAAQRGDPSASVGGLHVQEDE